MSVSEKIREILAEQALLSPSDIAVDASLEDIGIDSMGVVEVIFAIEETFSIEVPFNANDPQASAFDVSSVGAITAAVNQLIAEQKATG
ncbi:acyl carrier protein [Neptunicoccus cionae]|uniref:Phosphopantetheine-binding protein n=1 Tax=Neptunicoccus cionae TaxID=2035344 RepID=A0A916VQL5_9RHOB|nr:acyl carrier protein [Amylibacter cionae]GGA20863.1 phosphopantetheine-binding protein [Amylibacter cionae]